MARVEVVPEQFTLVEYDAGVIAGLAEELAAKVGIPDDVPVRIEIDEELPLPLTGSTADVVDGRAELWFSGANFEDGRHRATFNEQLARTELAMELFRAADRLQPGFAGAPIDENPIQLARKFREMAGFSNDEIDDLSEVTAEAQAEAEAAAVESRAS